MLANQHEKKLLADSRPCGAIHCFGRHPPLAGCTTHSYQMDMWYMHCLFSKKGNILQTQPAPWLSPKNDCWKRAESFLSLISPTPRPLGKKRNNDYRPGSPCAKALWRHPYANASPFFAQGPPGVADEKKEASNWRQRAHLLRPFFCCKHIVHFFGAHHFKLERTGNILKSARNKTRSQDLFLVGRC